MKESIIKTIFNGLPEKALERLALIISNMDDKSVQEEIVTEVVDGVPVKMLNDFEKSKDLILKAMSEDYKYYNIVNILNVRVAPVTSIIDVETEYVYYFKNAEDVEFVMANPNKRYQVSNSYNEDEEHPIAATIRSKDTIQMKSSELEKYGILTVKV